MNDPWDAGSTPPRRRVPWILVVAIVVAGAAGTALLLSGRERPSTGSDQTSLQVLDSGRRVATLYFADRDGRGFVPEERELPEGTHFESRVEAVVRALIDGPQNDDVLPVFPPGVPVRRAFFDAEAATLYVDFGAALVRQHPGGSTAEWQTWTALIRTLRANFAEVRRLQILVQGEPVESLAGHFDASRPIDLDTWQ
jgi:hypothetical protein